MTRLDDRKTVKPLGFKKRGLKEKEKNLIFYCIMIALPVLQFVIFYIGVNFNSILLAFRTESGDGFTLENFKNAIYNIFNQSVLVAALKNSFLTFVITTVISIPLGLLFSYYIAKKMPLSGMFRVVLFLPSILSAIVMVAIFQSFAESAIPAYMQTLFGVEMKGLLENIDSRYPTLVFYSIWIGFGTNVLMYSNAMSAVDPSIVESAHLDGAVGFKEFWHITLPSIYPTLVTFVIVAVAGIFINQLNLFSFYGGGAPEGVQTYGYYLYKEVEARKATGEGYAYYSALGLIVSCVAIPLTLLSKYLLEKFGPREE